MLLLHMHLGIMSCLMHIITELCTELCMLSFAEPGGVSAFDEESETDATDGEQGNWHCLKSCCNS